MTPAAHTILLGPTRFDPRRVPGLAAWYDVSDLSTVTYDGSNRVSALADKSGNGRTLVQATQANQPILTTAADGRHYLTFDGSNDYLKAAAFALAQPETVYFVGSQVTWTDQDTIVDGDLVNTMRLAQFTTTPNLSQYLTGAGAVNAGLALATTGVITSVFNGAGSSIRVNRGAAGTGSPGVSNAGGLTVASDGGIGNWANITVSEIAIYANAQDGVRQDAFVKYAGRKWGIAV